MSQFDRRDSVTRGTGPIVLRVANEYGFREHATVGDATTEATRLAEDVGGEFVVYVPVLRVRPAPRVLFEPVGSPAVLAALGLARPTTPPTPLR